MKLCKPLYKIIEQEPGINGIYKMIEHAGRVCYKSEDKITEDSAKSFVERMVKSKHLSVLEHGTVYLDIPNSAGDYDLVPFFASNPYSRVVIKPMDDRVHNYITTNFRVIVENFAEEYIPDVLQYVCEPIESHKKRITVKFTSDIHFYKDITRHRTMSFSIESTRFCNYSQDKFGNEINFATPIWLKEEEELEFEEDLKVLEQLYFKWLNKGWQPQQAAYFLAQGTKADVVMTGFVSDYKHFFDLRALGTTGNPHPTVKELALPLLNEFTTRKYF